VIATTSRRRLAAALFVLLRAHRAFARLEQRRQALERDV
jgi:hypothetical protein